MTRVRDGADRAAEWSSAVAVAAAIVVAMLLNVLGARHYVRWDVTREGRYTLAPSTVEALRGLQEPLQIHVLTSTADPVTLSVRHLLTAFGAHTSRLDVRFVDPDREPAEYLALQRRYRNFLDSEEERAIEVDAAIVVARGERYHMVPRAQLDAAEPSSGAPPERRIEQSIAAAMRQVLAPQARRICFTVGHGEDSLADYGPHGLGSLGERLRSNNFEAVDLEPRRGSAGADPVAGCALAIVAGPKEPFADDDEARLAAYLRGGGSVLVALGPVPDPNAERMVDVGLGELLGAGNMKLVADIVFELEPERRAAHGLGEAFFAEPVAHGATEALRRADRPGEAGVYLEVAGFLDTDASAPLVGSALLTSSARSFAMRDFFAWARAPRAPEPSERDRRGPLVLARAVELPQPGDGGATRPRMVAIAASSVLHGTTWQLPELRSTALFVEGVLGWLTAESLALDDAHGAERSAGPRLTEEALAAALRYALLYVPVGIVLLGVGVAIRRRSRVGASPRAPGPPAKAPEAEE